jgi:hypothetical protein
MLDINESTSLNYKEFKEFIDKTKDDMVNISGIPASIFENTNLNSTGFGGKYNMGNNPCEHCPNNPKNNPHSSGFCNCAAPALANPIY